MNSVVESPIMSASPLDQTYKEDDVNATNISPILSSGNRAPEEVEPMNVDSTAADECKPFPDSESVSLYTGLFYLIRFDVFILSVYQFFVFLRSGLASDL